MLLEFNVGYQVPPYNYNGFAANLEFIEGISTTEISAAPPPPPPPAPHQPPQTAVATREHKMHQHRHNAPPPALTEAEWTPAPPKFSPCDKIIIEANGRSGHFDTRGRPFAQNCRLIFKGKPTDVVHISLFNYRLKAQSCRSVIEVVDGALESTGPSGSNHKKTLHKMCSPLIRHARDQVRKRLKLLFCIVFCCQWSFFGICALLMHFPLKS